MCLPAFKTCAFYGRMCFTTNILCCLAFFSSWWKWGIPDLVASFYVQYVPFAARCSRMVWVLALSYWREVEEPCGAGKAIMMIFTMSDNEGNPRLGPRTNTQTKHTVCARTQSGTKRHQANTHLEAPPAHFACVLSVWVQSTQGNQRHTILPPGAELVAPPKGCYDDTPPPPLPLPLLTALFFYHTGNQTDSGALKPFLQLGDGDRGPRTSLMQPPSPRLVSWSHLWQKRRGVEQ